MSPEGSQSGSQKGSLRPPTAETLGEWAFGVTYGRLGVSEALSMRESRNWRFLPGHGVNRFAEVLSTAAIDAHLRTDAARTPRIAMADESQRGSAGVPHEEFTLDDGRVDLPRLLARFDAGASLVVSQFDETHPPLQRLCRGLEKLFLHAVQANLYLTPPAAQGFRTHYDTHDVLVLQVEGRKRWRVWDGEPLPRPTRRTGWTGKLAPEGEPHTLLLEPGDALYIPRGVFHDAATEPGETSLHITLGFLEPSWAEALRQLLDDVEATDPALRESVPTWRIGEDDLHPALEGALARLAAPGLAERLQNLLLSHLPQDRQPLPARGLMDRMPEGKLRLADGMHHHVVQGEDGVVALHWPGGVDILTAEQMDDLTALADGAIPRDRDFAAHLWRHGMLERG
ncbi:cupin domain-containing protein [Roseococcus microcysteis]|uniref:cupin domain-containing protein n=1 Tax=Roseococcus microcysteis TaxID=2771361 RepID=UPI00168BEF43|nr:cupin domain-containing protein [Roseococcus microcysteis]